MLEKEDMRWKERTETDDKKNFALDELKDVGVTGRELKIF